MKYWSALFLCLFSVQVIHAQEVLENNPPSVKWYRVTTPHFKVLYPKGFEDQAQRVANTLEHIREAEGKSMGATPRKFPVILQNQSAESNGFVSLIPKRSEFYTMPPQDYNFGGTNDWLNQLATHEYRHMTQFTRANTGFNRVLYYLFGPATLAAMATSSVPQWFWEGDAVATETAFTHSGRGRIPNFGVVFRTNLQEGRVFNYSKQYLRSYKHNITDHYVFGYHMISYLRKRTGDPEIWSKIGKRTWDVPFIPFAFSSAIKKESGLKLPQLYREMVSDLQKTWEAEQQSVKFSEGEPIMQRNTKAYTDYQYPQLLSDGSVLAMKSGIGDIIHFVAIKNGNERKVFIPGIVNDAAMLSASGTTIVWTEYGYDPRWRVKSYSLIKAYDVATRRYWVITKKSRYAGAALSPDGKNIVTVESDNAYKTSLTVIDSEHGQVLKKFENPENSFYSMARFADDGKKIVALKTMNGNRSVVVVDSESGKETTLITPSKENIGHPVLSDNYLFYNSPVSGIDNIYAFDLQNGKKLQVTNSKYGCYNAAFSADGKTMYYHEQTRDGFEIVSIPVDRTTWREFVERDVIEGYVDIISKQEGRPTLFDSIPQQNFATKKYSKLSGIINPYSWGAYFNTTFTQADIGISSQDILSTTSLKAGYLFDIYERTGAWHVGVSYQNWYPIIDVDFKYANRSGNEGEITYDKVVGTDTTENVTENLTFDWKESTIEAGLRIPLLTTNSRYHGNFTISNYVGYTHVTDFVNSIDGGGRIVPSNYPQYFFRDYLDNGSLIYNRFGLSAYRLLKQSRRDINSKFGQTIFLNSYNTPYGGDFSGKQFSFYTTLYFPGLFKHHSIWGYWAFQSTDIPVARANGEGLDNYLFNNQIPLPRGLSVSRFQKFYSMSANYTLPIWYADVAMGPFINIQRLKGNAFFDYGFGSSSFGPGNETSQTYASVGGELKVDINLLRYIPQFEIGVRYSYGLEPSVTKVEFLVGLINF